MLNHAVLKAQQDILGKDGRASAPVVKLWCSGLGLGSDLVIEGLIWLIPLGWAKMMSPIYLAPNNTSEIAAGAPRTLALTSLAASQSTHIR